MKKINIIFSVIIGLIIFSVFYIVTNIVLENETKTIITKDEINSKMIAIMLEQSDGTYLESNLNKWPTDMEYNNAMSGCVDKYGNVIENALTFDTNSYTAEVYIKTTGNCYLYFDIKD